MINEQNAYLIVDIGTGNVRAAVVSSNGDILSIKRENVIYEKDVDYEDSIYFDPDRLWQQIKRLSQEALAEAGPVMIKAITATSQREGIVAIDAEGRSILGMPNIDHRGRQWEDIILDKSRVYDLTGRYPTSLFSALKLVGLRAKKTDLWDRVALFLSISDWVQYKFSGVPGYEHSQASETLLYDVPNKQWSEELCTVFSIPTTLLPPLKAAGTVLNKAIPEVADQFGIDKEAIVVVGGSDTQLAIRSMEPATNDVVIVSGTTTPIIKLVDNYVTDKQQRTWTSRHVDENRFVLEANAGVTGLNYQRLKEIFYPNETYEVIEKELDETTYSQCVASLGSLIADEDVPLTKGGFIFNAPVSHQLTRGGFVFAILWDIACSIYENYNLLCAVAPHEENYIWACGGGVQSRKLRQFIANLFGKEVRIRDTFRQSSVLGGAFLCNDALGITNTTPAVLDEIAPEDRQVFLKLHNEWKKARSTFKQMH
ncbi:FGGY-family carbohydrate kinase [Parapedobacter tibetensis]|uniref:FGGY-family carbohydrate kinase n=1 Tax=Parapedobacter tibetensis TaxID=2972951 RepID=UPI00214DDCE6|nr:FGGY family carbohydrate kinase [Parapedobacter tibetensis]